ncbi:BamA/TamA family outer membrane protein [Crocinitomix algicola]|uniref:BamA/TamA family outer membrane protein n=1 Tax=Crocinitomix algicola TaxID=1740263 RepID=UPI0008304AEC|nr:BamA/TamA family outer membrane protein [Crocinitomix algicola]
MIRFFSLLLSLLYCFSFAQSSNDTTNYDAKNDFSLTGFPVVFFLPETSLSFGAAGIMVFNAGKEKAWRKSQISLGSAYTLKNQILFFLPYELYLKQKWKIHGELGYYRYFFNYFGIGIDSKEVDLETYDANFPRLLATLSYRVKPTFLVGFQYRFDYFEIPRMDSLLTLNNPIGSEGGVVSTVGISMSYDTRDDIFYPRKGVLANFIAETSGDYTLADFSYGLMQLDVTHYFTLKDKHTIATNLYTGTTIGNSPFFTYYYFSSGKKGRGFNDRRFIDRNIGMLQMEYRFPIYKRLRGTVFSSIGSVGNTYSDVFTNRQLWSYGGGLRFQLSKKQMSHLRLDIARGFEGLQFYMTIGEAF